MEIGILSLDFDFEDFRECREQSEWNGEKRQVKLLLCISEY